MNEEPKKKRFGGRKRIAIAIACSIIIILGAFIILNQGKTPRLNLHQGVIQVKVQGGPHADYGGFTLYVHEVGVVMNQTIRTSQSFQYNFTVIWADSQTSSNSSFSLIIVWKALPDPQGIIPFTGGKGSYYETAIVPDGGIATVNFTIG